MQKARLRKVKVLPKALYQESDGPDLSPGRLARNWEQRGLNRELHPLDPPWPLAKGGSFISAGLLFVNAAIFLFIFLSV